LWIFESVLESFRQALAQSLVVGCDSEVERGLSLLEGYRRTRWLDAAGRVWLADLDLHTREFG
jgi:hypothetical protein